MTEELKCTCNDEFKTGLCPVCFPENQDIYDQFKKVLITDANILPQQVETYTGHVFKCPKCQNPIMVNMKFCPSCGVGIILQSKIVTDHINNITANLKRV